MTEEERKNFNKKIWDKIKSILGTPNNNLHFIAGYDERTNQIKDNHVNLFYYFLKIPESLKSQYKLNNLSKNYLNYIDEKLLNKIWNLNNIISSILRFYIYKIERKIKLHIYYSIKTLPWLAQFWKELFYKKNNNNLKQETDYNTETASLNLGSYDSFKNKFWKPIIDKLGAMGFNNYSVQGVNNNINNITNIRLRQILSNLNSNLQLKDQMSFRQIVNFYFTFAFFQKQNLPYNLQNDLLKNIISLVKQSQNDIKICSIYNNSRDSIIKNAENFLIPIVTIRNKLSHGNFILNRKISAKDLNEYTSYFSQLNVCKSSEILNYLTTVVIPKIKNLNPSITPKTITYKYLDDQRFWTSSKSLLLIIADFFTNLNLKDIFNLKNRSHKKTHNLFDYEDKIEIIKVKELENIILGQSINNISEEKETLFGKNKIKEIDKKIALLNDFYFSLFFDVFLISPFVSKNTLARLITELLHNVYLHFEFIDEIEFLNIYKENVITKLFMGKTSVKKIVTWIEKIFLENILDKNIDNKLYYEYVSLIKDILFYK